MSLTKGQHLTTLSSVSGTVNDTSPPSSCMQSTVDDDDPGRWDDCKGQGDCKAPLTTTGSALPSTAFTVTKPSD